MKEMNNKFSKYKKAIIKLQIQSLMPERFINLLWNRGVYVQNIYRIDITTVNLEVNLSDFKTVEEIAKITDSKIKILQRRGLSFLLLRFRKKITLIGGIIIFAIIIYYLSTFIWRIEIKADRHLSPYEIRAQLSLLGISPGINKSKLNVYALEEKIIKNNDNIMWVRARIEGSKLKVSIAERVIPPNIVTDDSICDMVAKMDGQIVRVYTISGTPVVKPGDVVKKGQTLIKGEQGKEGNTYKVHSEGDVIAKTFYEFIEEMPLRGVKKARTGKSTEALYIEILGSKIYLKKPNVNFSKYDKIEESGNIIKKVIYYEIKEEKFQENEEVLINTTLNSLMQKMERDLDKKATIMDKVVNKEYSGDNIKLKVVFIVTQNIALKQKVE